MLVIPRSHVVVARDDVSTLGVYDIWHLIKWNPALPLVFWF
jgi:hypothetical protein